MVIQKKSPKKRRNLRGNSPANGKPDPTAGGDDSSSGASDADELAHRIATGQVGIDELDTIDADDARGVTGWAKVRRIFTFVSKQDARVIRRFSGYLRPHLGKIVFATSLSILAGLLVLAQLMLIQRGLSALDPESLPPSGQASGAIQRVVDFVGLGGSSVTTPPDDWSAFDPEFTLASKAAEMADDNARRDQLLLVVIGVIGLAIFTAILKYVQGVTMSTVSRLATRRIREDAFRNLVRLPLRFHQATHSGQILARLIKDINRLRTVLVSVSLGITTQLAVFLGALGYALSQTSWAALFAVGFVVVAIVPIRIVADKIRHRDKAAEAGSGDLFAIATEAISGQKVVKAFTAEGHETRRFNDATRSLYEKQMVTYRLRAATEPLVDVVAGVGVAAGFWFLGAMVIDGDLKLPVLATVLVALQKLAGSVRRLGKLQNDFVRGIAAAERVQVLLSTDNEKDLQDEDAMPLKGIDESIEFADIRFGYDPEIPILEGVNLLVAKGETVAIVGPSGAGKTTLVDLLPRFFDVDEGVIRIDGHDIRKYRIRSLRSRIGIVSQETMLFRGTIRENIAYGSKEVDDATIEAAAKSANAHDFIANKPKQYETILGERGSRLSGGERQRIAIARAILKDPPILILDEATSALDAESEAQVQRALDNLMRGRTTLVIAHRLATIRRAHRIVVLKGGSIQESGTHEELIRVGGHYARAYRLQSESMTRGEEDRPLDDFFEEEA